MDRLTERFNDGTVGVIDTLDNESLLSIPCYIPDDIANASICIAIEKLAEYEDLCLSVNGINNLIISHERLEQERDYWEREAKKYCSKLGEIRMLMEQEN